jgi:3',5'-cyclic AMP phosphodiesterase CpdA
MSAPPSQTVVAAPTHLKTRIVLVSDTHNQTPSLPRGDVLVHAGDLTNQGSHAELVKTVKWLERVGREGGFEAIVVVAGMYVWKSRYTGTGMGGGKWYVS